MILFCHKKLKYIVYCLFLVLTTALFTACIRTTPSQELNGNSEKLNKPITILFAGDAMHHMPQFYASYDYVTHIPDYKPSFRYVKPIIESADFSICNLEAPIGGRPYSGYPQFSAPTEFLEAIADAGFDLLQLANNHILDRGKYGLEQSIMHINNQNLQSIGAYLNEEHRVENYPHFQEIKGVKIAFLNYTYGMNGLRPSSPNVVNQLDSIQINKDFDYIEQKNADLIMVLVHWGDEYHLKINEFQKKWTEYFLRKGANLIVGSHPHVVQKVDLIKHDNSLVPVFYSLGNFISNQREQNRNGGIFAKIEINPKTKLISKVNYQSFYVHKGEINKKYQYYIIPTTKYFNQEFDFHLSRYDSLQLRSFHDLVTNRIKNIQIFEN